MMRAKIFVDSAMMAFEHGPAIYSHIVGKNYSNNATKAEQKVFGGGS